MEIVSSEHLKINKLDATVDGKRLKIDEEYLAYIGIPAATAKAESHPPVPRPSIAENRPGATIRIGAGVVGIVIGGQFAGSPVGISAHPDANVMVLGSSFSDMEEGFEIDSRE